MAPLDVQHKSAHSVPHTVHPLAPRNKYRSGVRLQNEYGQMYAARVKALHEVPNPYSAYAEALINIKLYKREIARNDHFRSPLRCDCTRLSSAYSLLLAVRESEIGYQREFEEALLDCRIILVNHVNEMDALGYPPELPE